MVYLGLHTNFEDDPKHSKRKNYQKENIDGPHTVLVIRDLTLFWIKIKMCLK